MLVRPAGPARDIFATSRSLLLDLCAISSARRVVELAAARGLHLEIEEDRGGISFPNFLADPGRIPVVDGLGPVGEGMHTREEWLDLRSPERRVVLLADLLATL